MKMKSGDQKKAKKKAKVTFNTRISSFVRVSLQGGEQSKAKMKNGGTMGKEGQGYPRQPSHLRPR
jgi:hypothetical protein